MSDSSDEEAFPISEYERAMLNKKKENQKLLNSLGLLQVSAWYMHECQL